MYDNLRDVEFRLRGTLVEYDGDLHYVSEVDVDDGYTLRVVGKHDTSVALTDPKLKITGIKTGYLNFNGKLLFLKRRPTRTYRQGLRYDNTSCTGYYTFGELSERIRYQEIHDEPLGEDIKILDKDYAVIRGKLYYRTRLVGVYYEGETYLSNEMKFLSESLEACNGI